jgi:hypothetical protein
MVFSIMAMLTGGVIFGALISRLTLLIDKRNPQARAYKERMATLKSYMDGSRIPVILKTEAEVSQIINLQAIFFPMTLT